MIGQQIQNYKVVSQIGEGGMGSVYLGVHTAIERKVAIKILRPEYARDAELWQRFVNEAKVLSGLSHQNIVSLLDFTEFNDNLCIIMEYVEGAPLDILLRTPGTGIPVPRATAIFEQILSAFTYAHSRGIVHRDIKPSNIILMQNDVPKILDFGIAKILEGDINLTRTGTRMGSVFYMSPEQILGENVDYRTDIYSLGVTYFEMLTGRKPFPDETSEFKIQEKITKEPLPPARAFNPGVPEQIDFFINKSTEKNPMNRFQSCRDFRDAILPFAALSGVGSSPTIAFATPSGTPDVTSTSFEQNMAPPPPPPPPGGGYNSPPPPPPPSSGGNYNAPTQYGGFQSGGGSGLPPYIQPPSKGNKGLYITLGVIGGLFLIGVIAAVLYFGLKMFKDDNTTSDKKKDRTEKITDDNNSDDKTDSKDKRKDTRDRDQDVTDDGSNKYGGAKLYFCEDYTDQEVNVSKVFTTGYLTVMVDLRPAGKTIGCKNVKLKLNKIKDADGNTITERTVKTVPFTVKPTFDYIYFTNKKDLKFTSPGTYRVYLYDDWGDEVVCGVVKITER
jgi:serine/threonine protein kinase